MVRLSKRLSILFMFMAISCCGFADTPNDGVSELEDAIKLAQQKSRPIFLQVSTTWCGWCRKMNDYIADNEPIKNKLAEKYQYCKILFNKETKAGVFSTFPRIPAYPHIFILDKDGGLLHSQYTGAIEKGSSYDQEKFMKLLTDWEDYSVKIEKMRQKITTKLQPVAKPDKLNEGLICRFYKGKWSRLPEFEKLKYKSMKVVQTISADKYNIEEFVGTNFKGFVHIEKAGTYNIRLSSNDGSRLRLCGKTVVDNDGLHQLKDMYAQVELSDGYYPIEVDYFRNGGHYGLIFSFTLAADSKIPLKFYHIRN